jgi:hypothetical protein
MNNLESITIPTTYTHSLKLEETAKGIRISVHVYANDQATVIEQTFQTYLKAIQTARDNKIQLVPMEENEK